MGFKANIEIGLSFSTLKICSIRQQGFIKFRVCLYHINDHDQKKIETISCHPYSIIKKPQRHHTIQNQRQLQKKYSLLQKKNVDQQQSQLDAEFYISNGYRVMFDQEEHNIFETCLFKTYVDVEKYPQLNLKCSVELLFCPSTMTQNTGEYKVIGRCCCKIRKLFDVSTYLPLIFDEFEGVVIEGTYNAALIDFHYEGETVELSINNGHSPQFTPNNFYEYLNIVSGGFNRQQTRKFYHYYREILEKELFSIQQRHYDLIRILNHKNEDFRMVRLNPNQEIDYLIDQLNGYNSMLNEKKYYHSNHSKSKLKSTSKQYYQLNKNNIYMKKRSSYQELSNSLFTQRNYSDISTGSTKSIPENPKQLMANKNQKLAQQILHDYVSIKALIYQKWSQFINYNNKNVAIIAEKYKVNYDRLVKERLAVNVFSHNVSINDWKKSAYENSSKDHIKQTEIEKKKLLKDEELWKQIFVIETQHFFKQTSKCIKIFEQIYPVVSQPHFNGKRFSLRSNNSLAEIEKPAQNKYGHISQHKKLQLHFHHSHSVQPKLSQNAHPHRNIQLSNRSPQQFFEEVEKCHENTKKEDHFVILVHGYQASRQDFMVMKNCLEIRFNQIKVFISTCNQGRTQDSIEVLGRRFALQLQKFINNSSPTSNYKISFIGHSMGGLIVRTALCYLQNINKNLYTYISLSTPHLGYLYEPSTHIQAGLWMMKTIQKSQSIEQICMEDKEETRQAFLYKLSRSGSLNNFKNLVFLGSAQDKYIPYQSARAQLNSNLISEKMSIANGQIIHEMIDGMLGRIQAPLISRMDIIFNIQESNFDTMIGRTAHIKYLSDRQFIKTFCIVFDKFFR